MSPNFVWPQIPSKNILLSVESSIVVCGIIDYMTFHENLRPVDYPFQILRKKEQRYLRMMGVANVEMVHWKTKKVGDFRTVLTQLHRENLHKQR